MTTSSTSTPDADRLLADALHRVWGFSEFRPLQREAMHAILDARDSVVVLPTGGGKSLCFQAPAVVDAGSDKPGPACRGLALVISPLISLMKDQVDGLRVDGVAASFLNSTLLPHERDEVIASVRDGRCRLLYVSPERLVGDGGPSLWRLLKQANLKFVAIDEAHCISQWGHDFRPEYRQLGSSPVPGRLMPMLAAFDSPGPLTTHPMTARVMVSTPSCVVFHSGILSRM